MTASSTRTAHQARLLQQKVTKKQNRPQGNYTHDEFQWGQVDGIDPGPPPTVSVKIDASTTATPNLKYLASYVPTVGDVVLIQRGKGRNRSSRMVLGKPVGSASPYPLPLGTITSEGMFVSGPNALWGGDEAPPEQLGNDGDWYLQGGGTSYYKYAGAWVSTGGGGSVGPTGPTGPTGPSGPSGAAGGGGSDLDAFFFGG